MTSDKHVMEILKDSIRERHTAMESLSFVKALTDGTLPIESYAGQLRAMAVIHGTLEHELPQIRPAELLRFLQARPSRLNHLRSDLAALEHLCITDCLEAAEQTRLIAEQIRRYSLEEPEALAAIIYVLEGTTLGNAVHLRDVQNCFDQRVAGCTAYYSGYGGKTEEYWQELRCFMNSIRYTEQQISRLTQVAHRFFDSLETLYRALHPIKEGGMGYTSGMLNPEAGNHPVPEEEPEIQAALASARRCRAEFPYFEMRYGDRGAAFARSDAAWLATLATLPGEQRLEQVYWLGRVLGNRGMPRITLERQLLLLQEELEAAFPERASTYSGLFETAEELQAQRLSCIPEPEFSTLASRFSVATDGEMSGLMRGSGMLLVSSVCDEACGITDAVSSLLSWFADPQRFTPEWIAAVEQTVEAARKSVSRHS